MSNSTYPYILLQEHPIYLNATKLSLPLECVPYTLKCVKNDDDRGAAYPYPILFFNEEIGSQYLLSTNKADGYSKFIRELHPVIQRETDFLVKMEKTADMSGNYLLTILATEDFLNLLVTLTNAELFMQNIPYILVKYVFNKYVYDYYDGFYYENMVKYEKNLLDSNEYNILKGQDRIDRDLFLYQRDDVVRMRKIEQMADNGTNIVDKNIFSQISIVNIKRVDGGNTVSIPVQNHGSCYVKKPKPMKFLSGGVISHDVGLGKTTMCISLMCEFEPGEKQLVFCPNRLIKQWKSEIEEYSKLRVHTVMTIIQYMKYFTDKDIYDNTDVVIVSYNLLANDKYYDTEYLKSHKLENKKLHKESWKRIIMDEAHEILIDTYRCHNRERILYEELLKICSVAKYKWICSATPFNNVGTLDTLIRLLLQDYELLSSHDFNYTEKCKDAIVPYIIARKKEDVINMITPIPVPVISNYMIEMTPIEKLLYESAVDDMERYKICSYVLLSNHHNKVLKADLSLDCIKDKMTDYYVKKIASLTQNIQMTKKRIQKNLLAISELEKPESTELEHLKKQTITKLKQDIEKDTSKTIENESFLKTLEVRYKVFEAINQKVSEFEACPICLDDWGGLEKSVTSCGHFVCRACLKYLMTKHNGCFECPICREKLDRDSVSFINENPDEKDDTAFSADDLEQKNKWGSKMSMLIDYLHATLMDESNRIIIFSQWDEMLKTIGGVLDEMSIKHLYLEGNPFVISNQIDTFKSDPTIRCIMLSSEKSVSGLNLTEANHIVLIDTFNGSKDKVPAIEKQAIGRAVRIGQKRQVQIRRFVCKNTIEESNLLANCNQDS